MDQDNWTVGGIPVPLVTNAKNNRPDRVITLSCKALAKNSPDGNPYTEIDMWKEMECDVITNTQLINGGSCLQICNGDPILVSNGVETWVAALTKIVINRDNDFPGIIDYDMIIHYETQGRGISYTVSGSGEEDNPIIDNEPSSEQLSSKKYIPPFLGINNISYNFYTDGSVISVGYFSDTIGKMIITETRNVKQVIIEGQAHYNNSYIEVNGARQNWIHTINEGSNPGWDILTFNLSPTSKIITIKTSPITPETDKGANLKSVTVVYE